MAPPTASVSPGGFWSGVDSNGGDVNVIVTETGKFYILTLENQSQGSGALSVSGGNSVTGIFQLVTSFGFVFQDGTPLADCALTGTVQERQTMTVAVSCTTTAGLETQFTSTLNYDMTYDRDSSLATIAGNFQGVSEVFSIAGDGTVFAQNAVTGCVSNGQVSIINESFNAYEVQYSFSNCLAQDSVLNGSAFCGIAVLGNSVSPEVLIIAATGDVAGTLASFIQRLDRI